MKWKALPVIALMCSPTLADERIGAFVLPDDQPTVIALDGDLLDTSVAEFREAVQRRPGATTLSLSSEGGYIDRAVTIARDAKAMGLATTIPAGGTCRSSCVVVFFAGEKRTAEGTLGVHQLRGDATFVQFSLATMISALDDFGAPRSVLNMMLLTTPDSIYLYQPSEMAALGITTQ
jgi:hypothetical protein